MPVFAQICQVASQAREQQTIPPLLAERLHAIGVNRLHYKHLGLELHDVVAVLTDTGSSGCDVAALEQMVRNIEDRHRRI